MKHLGDITKIHGDEIPPVDVITGGSPCQDLSVAGLRAGLSGERSGLFMEQIRIVKEMRERDRRDGRSTEFCRPRFLIWENVPGALSSSGGEDFRIVLEEICKVCDPDATIPRPQKRWGGAGLSWVMDFPYAGEFMTHSFGESPKDGVESHLLQILEDTPHPRYALSAKACSGILTRAEKQGKTLPTELKEALRKQSNR